MIMKSKFNGLEMGCGDKICTLTWDIFRSRKAKKKAHMEVN